MSERTEVRFSLKDFPAHVEDFGFILGVQKRAFRDQNPVNIKASELVGRLHDALHATNYRGHDLERFLVRVVFCLFADDTGIFETHDIFLDFIESRTSEDGADQEELDAAMLSLVNVDQFYGIEISEFPARIAETAMWMMDHIMNNRLSLEFGQTYARIPLETSPRIVHGDALEMDWRDLLPPEECSFVFDNPPFGGFVMRDAGKRSQMKEVIAKFGSGGSRLDYVAAWFLKAGEYFINKPARIASYL